MNNQYNFYNLEASFKHFLLAGNKKPISIKNYLSDLRHFLGWLTFYLKSKKNNVVLNSLQDFIKVLKQVRYDTIREYKTYLTENSIPYRTVNRRLSTVRRFCGFCISQGWISENPAKQLQNANLKNQNQISKLKTEALVKHFQEDLSKEEIIDPSVIPNYINDIKEFLEFISF